MSVKVHTTRKRIYTRKWHSEEEFRVLSYMRDLKIKGRDPQVSVIRWHFAEKKNSIKMFLDPKRDNIFQQGDCGAKD